MNYSPYQNSIFDWIKSGSGHAQVIAVAGSGKTTTAVEAAKYCPKEAKILFVAFNKAIAEAFQLKLPKGATAATLHKVGYGICRANIPWSKLNERKVDNQYRYNYLGLKMLWENGNREKTLEYFDNREDVTRMVSLCKGLAITPDSLTPETITQLGILYSVDTHGEGFFDCIKKVLTLSLAQTTVLDFDDMIYYPAIHPEWTRNTYDFIFVDEAQDLNKAQRILIRSLLADNGRVLFIGDPAQAIYGFRGASPTSMPEIAKDFSTKELPLTVSYRCAKSIVDYAKWFFQRIESWEHSPTGLVREVQTQEFLANVHQGDFVLCRCTAPLVSACFSLLAAGKKSKIVGKDLVEMLVSEETGTILQTCQKKWGRVSEVELEMYYTERKRSLEEKEKDVKIARLRERIDILIALTKHPQYNPLLSHKLVDLIRATFAESSGVGEIVLTTIHRAKGLEADRVWIIRPDLMPHPKATQAWQLVEEKNLQYVAATRAKSELYIVQGEIG